MQLCVAVAESEAKRAKAAKQQRRSIASIRDSRLLWKDEGMKETTQSYYSFKQQLK